MKCPLFATDSESTRNLCTEKREKAEQFDTAEFCLKDVGTVTKRKFCSLKEEMRERIEFLVSNCVRSSKMLLGY